MTDNPFGIAYEQLLQMARNLKERDLRPYGSKTCIVLNPATLNDLRPLIETGSESYPPALLGISGMRVYTMSRVLINGQWHELGRDEVIIANEDFMPGLIGEHIYITDDTEKGE